MHPLLVHVPGWFELGTDDSSREPFFSFDWSSRSSGSIDGYAGVSAFVDWEGEEGIISGCDDECTGKRLPSAFHLLQANDIRL